MAESSISLDLNDLLKLREMTNPFREELRQKDEQNRRIIDGYKQIWGSLKNNEQQTSTNGDGTFTVVSRSKDRLRLATTTDPELSLYGYTPPFDTVSGWQEVSIDKATGKPKQIHYWDKKGMEQIKPGKYWTVATIVVDCNLRDNPSSDDIHSTSETLAKVICPSPEKFIPVAAGPGPAGNN